MNDLQFGEFRLEQVSRRLYKGHEAVPISSKVFDLLSFLASNPNRLLPRTELQAVLWPDSFVEESNLSQNVFILRKALGEAGSGMIVTVPGKGYQFTAKVRSLPEPLPKPPALTGAEQPPQPSPQGTAAHILQTSATRIIYEEQTEEHLPFWRVPVVIASTGLALALAAAALWLGWQHWQDRVGGPPIQVVLADPNGSTGDPMLDQTLTNVTRISLSQSPFMTLVSPTAARETLKQMLRDPDSTLTSALARDVCERTGSQAVVQQSIARAGSHFLLTEEATDCADGAVLSAAREEADRAEELPKDIEALNTAVRRGMGESRRTIARFDAPLASAVTPSLDALKLWSEARRMSLQGRFAESADLNRRAIALDPQFATAYFDLGLVEFNNAGEPQMRAHLQKAYDLRARMVEPLRLAIEAFYELWIVGDSGAAERTYVTTLDLYPRNAVAMAGLASLYLNQGRHTEELALAKQLLPLTLNRLASYQTLAQAQLFTGDPAAALQTCRLALRRGLDGGNLRQVMLLIAYYQEDAELQAEQHAWRVAHPDETYLAFVEVSVLLGEGRIQEATALSTDLHGYHLRDHAPSAAARVAQGTAAPLFELGEPRLASAFLRLDSPLPEYSSLQARVDAGDSASALSELDRQLKMQPQSALWHRNYAPLLHGQLALSTGQTAQAIAELEQTREYDGREPDNLYYRGKAYLQAGRLADAELAFRALLARHYFDLAPHLVPLAHIQLARTLAKEQRINDADREYQTFLHLWLRADREQPLTVQALREDRALVHASVRPGAG